MPLVSRALRAFAILAEELHFGRAARRLHMSQPPLSQQIRQLEVELGATLFTRTTRSVQLTSAGHLLYERAQRLMSDADLAVKATRRLARGETGQITLGFTHSAVYTVLPQALRAFRRDHPGVGLELRQLTSIQSVENVRSGRVDVALVRFSPSMKAPELESVVIARDRMLVVAPADSPLVRRKAVPVGMLRQVPFVGYSPEESRYFYEVVEGLFGRYGVDPQVVHRSFLPTLIALVEARMGVALAPAAAIPRRSNVIAARPLSGVEQGLDLASLHCVWRRDTSNPLVEAFVGLLLQAPAEG